MQAVPPEKIGRLIGMGLGLRLWRDQVYLNLPSSADQSSVEFNRELIGLFSLAENVAAGFVLLVYPTSATPEFRNGLAAGIRGLAINGESTIRIADVLRVPVECELFCKFHWQRIERERREEIFNAQHQIRDAFQLVQEVRAVEFAAISGNTPMGECSASEAVQRLTGGTIRCAHLWIMGTTTISKETLMQVDRILDALLPEVSAVCENFLEARPPGRP